MPNLLSFLPLALLAFAAWPGQPRRGTWLLRLLALLMLSPLLRYVGAMFGFAMRLRLSEWAGSLLQRVGLSVRVDGNMLVLHGQEMAVDPACMGLQMTGFTLLLAVFWLLAYGRRQVRSLPTGWVLTYLAVALLLTLLANLMRIVLLVLFGLGPDYPLHELAGLACVTVYAWLPLWGLAHWLVGRFGKVMVPGVNYRTSMRYTMLSVAPVLLIGWLCFAFIRPTARPFPMTKRTGYVQKSTQFGFVQYSRPGELIYAKPLPDWYSLEHNPAVCWRGKGYTLNRIREVVIAGQRVYVGELKKGRQTLQTAWWFTNGTHQSISQIDVRTRMLRGEPGFALINVTVAESSTLPGAVRGWL